MNFAIFRQLALGLIALLSLGLTWYFGYLWVAAGGNILNVFSFFADAFQSGPAAAFLTIDLLACWLAYMIWVVADASRIGLGRGKGWGFLALSFLGTCFAFPIYLIVRERHLARQAH
ncbi:DUF2834 domain-containing protein [Spongiibacter taiwanensis]|uniref:DUF2834 domain-containing protein n=1 Tax=Spongiibacter taiwanensis TaxID=1748242 RepID=UPI002034CEC9|nr:DUF2834 domain-containing protein [Spongiibacter taiwanensis]USA41641.1 DUF2834 domain-containing protein [Spongiibacter taiwanensis]